MKFIKVAVFGGTYEAKKEMVLINTSHIVTVEDYKAQIRYKRFSVIKLINGQEYEVDHTVNEIETMLIKAT